VPVPIASTKFPRFPRPSADLTPVESGIPCQNRGDRAVGYQLPAEGRFTPESPLGIGALCDVPDNEIYRPVVL